MLHCSLPICCLPQNANIDTFQRNAFLLRLKDGLGSSDIWHSRLMHYVYVLWQNADVDVAPIDATISPLDWCKYPPQLSTPASDFCLPPQPHCKAYHCRINCYNRHNNSILRLIQRPNTMALLRWGGMLSNRRVTFPELASMPYKHVAGGVWIDHQHWWWDCEYAVSRW